MHHIPEIQPHDVSSLNQREAKRIVTLWKDRLLQEERSRQIP